MKPKSKFTAVIIKRLDELNLAKLPPQVIEHLEAELLEDFTRLAQRRLTTDTIARAIPRVLRARKATPDAASATVANG